MIFTYKKQLSFILAATLLICSAFSHLKEKPIYI